MEQLQGFDNPLFNRYQSMINLEFRTPAKTERSHSKLSDFEPKEFTKTQNNFMKSINKASIDKFQNKLGVLDTINKNNRFVLPSYARNACSPSILKVISSLISKSPKFL